VMLLKRFPANCDLVAKVLGHKDSRTTLRPFVGLETMEANELFAKLIRGRLRSDDTARWQGILARDWPRRSDARATRPQDGQGSRQAGDRKRGLCRVAPS
jgi:hypothetical protein